MPLPSRPLHIPAGLAIDESTREELLEVGVANVEQKNVRSVERGTLEKRLGFLSTTVDLIEGADRDSGRRLFAHNGVPCVVTADRHLDIWSEAADKWRRVGRVSEATQRVRSLPCPVVSAEVYDLEYMNGYLAVAYGDELDAKMQAAVVDYETGAYVSAPSYLHASDTGVATVASFGGRYFVAMTNGAALKLYLFDVQNPASGWTALVTVTSSFTGEASICSLADRVAVVWATSSGTNRVNVATYNASGGVGSTTIDTSSTTPDYVDIDASDTLWVAWSLGGSAYAQALTSALATTGTASTVQTSGNPSGLKVAAGTSVQTARVVFSDLVTAVGNVGLNVASLSIVAGAVTASAGETIYGALVTSRPFCRAGRYYMTVSPMATSRIDNVQGRCVLVDWTDDVKTMRPVANVEPGLVVRYNDTCKTVLAGGDLYATGVALLKAGGIVDSSDPLEGAVIGAGLAEFAFVSRTNTQAAAGVSVTHLSGGVLQEFDGARVVETGFMAAPKAPLVQNGGAGSLTGTYSYVLVYEDVDAGGNVTYSSISAPVSATQTSKIWRIRALPLAVTSRMVDVAENVPSYRVAIYRTVNGGEPPYYRLADVTPNFGVSSVVYDDETDDATLSVRRKLYAPNLPGALGEALDRRAPPGLEHVVTYAGMVVGARGGSLIYSGQPIYGEAQWFSPVFEVPIPGVSEITGLAAMDGALFVFTPTSVLVTSGEIPSDNGAAGGIGQPRVLASDVGCIDANSVAVCSIGVWFQSRRGLELLTRSQTVEWVGEPVQETLATYPIVTSAVVDDRNSLVRFTLAAALEADGSVEGRFFDDEGQTYEGEGGVDVIYDTALRMWISVDERGDLRPAAQHAAMVTFSGERRYAWLGSDGVMHYERSEGDASAYRDGSDFVTATYTLPPFKFGLQQEQRVYEWQAFVERLSDADLLVEVAEDYGAFGVVTDDKTWTSSQIGSARTLPFRTRSHGHSVQLRVSDIERETGDDGAGFMFIGISADAAPKAGPTRSTVRTDPGLRR